VKKSDLEFIVFGLALIALLILATWLATRSLTGVPFAQTPVGNFHRHPAMRGRQYWTTR
jgi:hypothetical protein